jgi:riboflavin synthase
MFTGIVSDVGELLAIEPRAEGLVCLTIACSYAADSIDIGASIACSGVCLTVVARGKDGDRAWFTVEAGAETLRVTTLSKWRLGQRVNLERALKVGDELGGHIVSGHVDGIAVLVDREDRSEMAGLTFRLPPGLAHFVAQKGSIDLDGVSLTVNQVAGDTFSVLIIPHTLRATALAGLTIGDELNCEVDVMARYAARLMERK